MPKGAYSQQIQKQRQAREKRLTANPRNWFSLIGLFPLVPGVNSLGGKSPASIIIPGLQQAVEAVFLLEGNAVILGDDAKSVVLNRSAPQARALCTDHDGEPDILGIGSVQIMVIQRGEKFFLRAWDVQSTAVKEFKGLNYYPIDPAWQIRGEFVPYPTPRIIPGEDAIGTRTEVAYIGEAIFEVNGVSCRLMAADEEDGLLFNFTDLTRSDTTYPGGRWLLSKKPVKNAITLDFNLAQNWPCAYTPYATCPLPPLENRLQVRIEAGEKRYS